jgi:hypothetical protein
MRLIGKLVIIIILLGLLLGASAYIILYTGDTEPPQFQDISGNLTVTAGQTVTISTLFSDNVNVTVATLYYKVASSTSWASLSILNGSVFLDIPSSATNDYYYYVTIDDAAGNGPIGNPSNNGSQYYIITVIPAGDNHGNETFIHTVFVEEATATWCTNCPAVANILHSLYESPNYRFYYVSMVNGTSSKVTDRLFTDYNILGFPTVFIDGGYKVIVGGNNPESTFADAIVAAQARATVPNIKIMLTAEYKNTSQELTVKAQIYNNENNSYTGRVKLYLTEIISHWTGYDSKPYRYSFLDFIPVQNDVTIPGKDNSIVTGTMNISAYDYENLMIIGVVFSSEKQQGYAQPPSSNPFDAYYADATNATKIVEQGNLPPQVEIASPQKGKAYWNGNEMAIVEKLMERKHLIKKLENISILKTLLYNKTYLLGRTKIISVNATDDSAVAQVVFTIDGTIVYNDTEAPYEFSFTKLNKLKTLFFKDHTLTVTVYDDAGKSTSTSIMFKARI